MPGYDGSGPMGSGSMSGGARGNCIPGNEARRYFERPIGLCRRRSSGRRFQGGQRSGYNLRRSLGRGFWDAGGYYEDVPDNTANEINILKSQAHLMRNTLESIEKKISEIEKFSTKDSDEQHV